MSFVTRCPTCSTAFKVVKDQLRVSDGWVRCGRCDCVFDATDNLREIVPEDTVPPSIQHVQPTVGSSADARPPSLESPSIKALEVPSHVPMEKPAFIREDTLVRATSASIVASSSQDDISSLVSSINEAETQLEEALQQAQRMVALAEESKSRKWPRLKNAMRSFIAKMASQTVVPPRWLFPALCIVALMILLLQMVRQERDELVARSPALRPVLEALCQISACQIEAPRQIDAITIDGSSFTHERNGQQFRLMFTLRSTAAMPLAMPAVELSLLDTQERAAVRRVLTPAQFGAPRLLGPKAEQSVTLAIEFTDRDLATLSPVVGYRLVAFYP